MLIILEQVAILFIFAIAGYILSRGKIVKSEQAQILSNLLVYVFLPANIIKTFAKNCTIEYICQRYNILTVGFVSMITIAVLAHFGAKLLSKKSYNRKVYEYSMVVPNFGYMGSALAESLIGAEGLLDCMMIFIPVSFYTYTVGYCMLAKRELSFKKLINPVMISLSIGIIIGIFEIKIPGMIDGILVKSSSCMAPVSMLLTGIVISEYKVKELINNKSVYITVLFRLIIIPVIVGLAVKMLAGEDIARFAVIFYAMPCGLNTVVFPKMVGEDCKIGAGFAFISNIGACFTIPLVFGLFGIAV